MLVWSTKDFTEKEHKVLRCNVEFDHGLFVKWSPDSKAFVVQKAVQNCTEVYRMSKKADGSLGDFNVAVTFPAKHQTDIIGMGISATGRFIATCSDKTELIVWNLKGEVLDKIGKGSLRKKKREIYWSFTNTGGGGVPFKLIMSQPSSILAYL